MRRVLDRLYKASEYLAAAFLAAIGLVVLAQVLCNIANAILKLTTGESGDYAIPSYAEFSGFFLASTSFLALAGTFRAGVHIRVSLLIQHISGSARRVIEIFCLIVAILLVAYFSWYMLLLIMESFEYQDMSPGLIAVPLWIPQISVGVGLIVFLVALIDALFSVIGGAEQAHGEPELSESGE